MRPQPASAAGALGQSLPVAGEDAFGGGAGAEARSAEHPRVGAAPDANGNELTKSGEATYSSNLENRLTSVAFPGDTSVAYAYDVDGNRVQTVSAAPTTCTGNTAVYTGADTTTQGSWIGKYGGDGEYINAETAVPPSYGSVTVTGASSSTWASSTSQVQALQDPPPGTSRIGSEWFSTTNETFSVVTNDQRFHTVALYMVDWNSAGRTQTVTAQTTSGTVLSAAVPVSGFSAGQWAVYTICGSVNFKVAYTGPNGSNAVVSGVFLGTPEASSGVTNYLVDTAGGLSQVVAEKDGGGALTALYVRNGDELLSVMRPGGSGGMWTTHFVHADGLGSVRTITDEGGEVVDTRGYEAFGTKNVEAGSETLAYGFAGEAFDSTTKLAYHRARWMDARVGRFTGMDPLDRSDDIGASSLYFYGDADPVDLSDPTGEDTLVDVSVSVEIVGVDATLAMATFNNAVASSAAAVCVAEALGSAAGANLGGPCSVYWVRLQAQGPATVRDALRGGPKYNLIDNKVKESWIGPRPAQPGTVAEGLAGLTQLEAQLSENQLKDRLDGFRRARRFISNAPPYGVGPPGDSFGAAEASSVRVDVDIKQGINFKN